MTTTTDHASMKELRKILGLDVAGTSSTNAAAETSEGVCAEKPSDCVIPQPMEPNGE